MAVDATQPLEDRQRVGFPGGVDTHQEPPSHNQPYRPALDGVRALAIVPVLLFHLREQWFPGGFVGVDVFFVISGFLITNGLLRDLQRGDFSLWRFYQRRIARLFPSMALVLLVTACAALLVYDRAVTGLLAPSLMASVASAANLLSAYESSYFSAGGDTHPFLHFWSLSVEEQFYLCFPVVLLLLWRWRRRAVVAGLVVLLAGSLAACVWETGHDPTWAFYMLPTRAWELMAGALVAAMMPSVSRWSGRSRSVAAWTGLLVLLLGFAVVRPLHFPGAIATVPVLGAVLLIPGVGGDRGHTRNRVEALFSNRAMVETGKLSYVLYLWHLPVFCMVDYGLFLTAEWGRTALKLLLTVGLAWLTAYFVENPARWWLNRRENRTVAFLFAGTAVVLTLVGGSWMRVHGWPEPRSEQIATGGLHLNRGGRSGTVALVGDSQACASAAMLHDLADEHGLRLDVMCESSTVPMKGAAGDAWARTLLGVERVRPDVLVYEVAWPKDPRLPQMLAESVAALQPYTRRLVLVLQYPVLQRGMPREAMREGLKLPFYELPENKPWRDWSNGLVRSFARQHGLTLIEMDPKFTLPDGSVRVLDARGRPLYFDWMHATSVGTATYRDDLERAILLKP